MRFFQDFAEGKHVLADTPEYSVVAITRRQQQRAYMSIKSKTCSKVSMFL